MRRGRDGGFRAAGRNPRPTTPEAVPRGAANPRAAAGKTRPHARGRPRPRRPWRTMPAPPCGAAPGSYRPRSASGPRNAATDPRRAGPLPLRDVRLPPHRRPSLSPPFGVHAGQPPAQIRRVFSSLPHWPPASRQCAVSDLHGGGRPPLSPWRRSRQFSTGPPPALPACPPVVQRRPGSPACAPSSGAAAAAGLTSLRPSSALQRRSPPPSRQAELFPATAPPLYSRPHPMAPPPRGLPARATVLTSVGHLFPGMDTLRSSPLCRHLCPCSPLSSR
jgi:hypothetical protein